MLLWSGVAFTSAAFPHSFLPVRHDQGHEECLASSLETTRIAKVAAAAAAAATDLNSLQGGGGGGVNYREFGAGHAYYNDSGSISVLHELRDTFINLAFLKDELFEYHFCRGHEEGEGSTPDLPSGGTRLTHVVLCKKRKASAADRV